MNRLRPVLFLTCFSLFQALIIFIFSYLRIQDYLPLGRMISLGVFIAFLALGFTTGLFLSRKYISKNIVYLKFFNITSTVSVFSCLFYSLAVSILAGYPFIDILTDMISSIILISIFTGAFVSAAFTFIMRSMKKDEKKEEILDQDLTKRN